MTTETVLSVNQIERIASIDDHNRFTLRAHNDVLLARAIEQAVLQSEQVQALRKDAEAYKWAIKNAIWLRHEHVAYVAVPVDVNANLSCPAFRVDAINAAMEQQK